MKVETIRALFANVLFLIGVLFVIFGFISGTRTLVRSLLFENYPLASYEETRCTAEYMALWPVKEDGSPAVSEEEQARRRAACEQGLQREREVRQSEDIVIAVTTFVSGFVLVLAFGHLRWKAGK